MPPPDDMDPPDDMNPPDDMMPGEMMFDPEFVWVADFLRLKCVDCHDKGQNGNLLLPNAEMSNEEIRAAIDGVQTKNSNRMIIDPGNAADSQAYRMITNAGGEQFPKETTDRFAAWINSGAPYYVGE